MSVRLMAQVFAADPMQFSPAKKLVLLAMADFANDDGCSIWPSNKTLVKMTGLSERAVRCTLRALEDQEVIQRLSTTAKRTYEYRILPDALTAKGAPDAPMTRQEMPPIGAGDAPDPSIDPSNGSTSSAPSGADNNFSARNDISPHVYELPENISRSKELKFQIPCQEHCGGMVTVENDECPKCGWPCSWPNSKWREHQREKQGADWEAQRRRLARSAAITNSTLKHLQNLARATSPDLKADFAKDEADRLQAYIQAYGDDYVRSVIDQCASQGDKGRGLIRHVLNKLEIDQGRNYQGPSLDDDDGPDIIL